MLGGMEDEAATMARLFALIDENAELRAETKRSRGLRKQLRQERERHLEETARQDVRVREGLARAERMMTDATSWQRSAEVANQHSQALGELVATLGIDPDGVHRTAHPAGSDVAVVLRGTLDSNWLTGQPVGLFGHSPELLAIPASYVVAVVGARPGPVKNASADDGGR